MKTQAPRRRRDRSSPYTPPQARGGGRRRRRSRPDPRILSQLDSAATAALVLGIVSLLCALAAPFAIWQGNLAARLARQARVPTPGGAVAGQVIGWIVVGLTLAAITVYVALIGALVTL